MKLLEKVSSKYIYYNPIKGEYYEKYELNNLNYWRN